MMCLFNSIQPWDRELPKNCSDIAFSLVLQIVNANFHLWKDLKCVIGEQMWACWVCRFFGIKNIGSLTLGMSNLGAASGTLNSGTDDDNDATCLEGGCVGTLNVGGEGRSVLGMPSFGIEKNGMSGTLMSGTGKTIASGTTLTSLGRMWRGTTASRQQCPIGPILALTLACPLLPLPSPAAAVKDEDGQKTSLPWQRHHRHHHHRPTSPHDRRRL